ncbi:MAG: dihydrolipoyl dehydrogenase [Sphaerochaetaceae bacterium]|jgi:dihydrolipoamide dehydrogenase
MDKFDLIVIGAGPGGYVAAQKAGSLGKNVLLVEKSELGGVCTNLGCIPTKSLLNSAKIYRQSLDSEKMGVSVSAVNYDLETAMAWKQETIETLRNGIAFLMKHSKVNVVKGEAKFLDSNTIKVGNEIYKGENFIIATGSSPAIVPIPGHDLDHVLTSNEILSIDSLPNDITVIGGGVIGMEFASYFHSLGIKVTVIEMLDEILPMMDKEFAKLMRREMKGVTFNLGCKVTEITKETVKFIDAKGNEKEVEAAMVLLSIGRRPNLGVIGDLDIKTERGAIVVDESLKTNFANIWAIGDVNGKSLLAHSATKMGEVVIENLYNNKSQRVNYNAIPWAVYGMPEAGGCGLSEDDAAKKGITVKTATSQMRSNGRFLAENGKRASGICKVIVEEATDVIVGIHLLGPYSSEIIAAATPIIEKRMKVEDVKEMVFAHPSIAEIIRDTLFLL